MPQEPDGSTGPARNQPDNYRPWTRRQVRTADSWPTRRDQTVSVALSPVGDRLALSVGQRIRILGVSDDPRVARQLKQACALAPGLTWSPGGDKLAFRDDDGQGRVIDLSGRVSFQEAERRMLALGPTSAMAFIPGSDRLAVLTASSPGRMRLTVVDQDRKAIWEQVLTRERMSSSHPEGVNLALSPDGHLLACTTGTSAVWVFDTGTGQQVRQFDDHSQTVTGLSWIGDEQLLSASMDATLRVWRPDDPVSATVVETIAAAGLVFARERRTALIWSARGELLAWSLAGTPAQLWDRNPPSRNVAAYFTRPAVSAVAGLLALVDAGSTELLLVNGWDRVDSAPPATTTYANAKVLLLGDSGVGKSGLAMVLAGKEFTPTESTHGRRIWQLQAADPTADEQESSGDSREVMLWDLAGQPGYRIVHQLHLEGAALALILFDAKSETMPLAGVRHWARAVRHAHPAADGGLPTFLVAARSDRGGITVSDQRIQQLMADFGLAHYFKTSAKEGMDTDLLRSRLLGSIDWSRIPEVTSTTLFAAVKTFVMEQRSSSVLLTPINELCRLFQAEVPSGVQLLTGQGGILEPAGDNPPEPSPAGLTSVFEGCIARLESAGLVKRLKVGDYVLLQPELLDAYAGAMVNAARDEPDGLGSILETKVVNVDFPFPAAERVRDRLQERLLVLATLEELLLHELVLREPTKDGVQLVFPSAYRRDLPTSEIPKGDGVVFRFEGPIENIYATLIVRLTRSDRFRRVDAWQSAARFAAEEGACTVALKFEGEGEAELLIGYDRVPDAIRKQFERFVHTHLERWATPGTIARERRYNCPDCGLAFTSEMIREVNRRGRLSILCPVCEERVPLRDDYEASGIDQATAQMDASADAGREIEAATAVLRGKTAVLRGQEDVAEYDVFLSYNWRDKDAVRSIARLLRNRGLRPWMDERQLRPGSLWQPELEEIIARVPAAAVVIGGQRGPWQTREIYAFIQQSVSRGCAIVPVLLPDANTADLPVFLQGLTWVNLAVPEPDPIDQLVWGVTGQQLNR